MTKARENQAFVIFRRNTLRYCALRKYKLRWT